MKIIRGVRSIDNDVDVKKKGWSHFDVQDQNNFPSKIQSYYVTWGTFRLSQKEFTNNIQI